MCHKILTFLLFLVLSSTLVAKEEVPKRIKSLDGKTMKLIWHDEFNYSGYRAHPKKWSLCERGGADWHNYMSKRKGLLKVKNGKLFLRGVVNPDQEKGAVPFLTAGVTSKDKFSFKYGKVLIRAKFDSAKGAWPALWMLGEKGRWPANGEIDLMEHLNFDDFVYQTVHSDYTVKIDKTNTPNKSTRAKIKRDEYNVYGVEWDKDSLTFTVNGKATLIYPRRADKGPKQFPFEQPFYFVLSMQVEGSWVGKADPSQYPIQMAVDWVRVYQ